MDTKDFKRLEKMYSPRYLPGLDGLRAFAVIGIIIYHLNAQWLSGGFLGVDTFFVISGYLITSLLISEYYRTQNRFARVLEATIETTHSGSVVFNLCRAYVHTDI